MPKIKGTDITGLKEILTKGGKESAFLSKLSESDRKIYDGIIATSWTDVSIQDRLYRTAADILFPNVQNACERLGQQFAERAYSSIYSVFLLIPKPTYVIKRAANVWKSYHDKGNANAENITNNSVDLVVRGYPELPKSIRDATTGNIKVLLGKTGAKNINITHMESNSEAWTWHITWD